MGKEFFFSWFEKQNCVLFFSIFGLYISCLLGVSKVIVLSQHSKLAS